MNKLLFGVLCFVFVVAAGRVWADDGQRRYETKSAVIEFAITGDIQGSETAYIDDFGGKEVRFSKYMLNLTGHDQEQDRVMLREGDILTNVDLIRMKSLRIDLTKEMTPGLNIHLTGKEMADYTPEGLKKMRAVYVGEESVAGKTCKRYDLPFLDAKLWVYKNIALRYKSNTKGFIVEYLATAIKEGIDIPADKFVVPAGVMNVGTVSQNNIMGAIQPKNP